MDIHKPKPVHCWREFLKEYGIIVLGVLTALAGEQLVESIHDRREAGEAREALKSEMEHNLWAAQNIQRSVVPCLARQLTDLERWAQRRRTAEPLALKRPLEPPVRMAFRTSIWRIATAGVIAKMPFRERVGDAGLYDTLDVFEDLSHRLGEQWRAVIRSTESRQTTPAENDRLRSDLAELRHLNDLIAHNAAVRQDEELGLKPTLESKTEREGGALVIARQRDFCRPIMAS